MQEESWYSPSVPSLLTLTREQCRQADEDTIEQWLDAVWYSLGRAIDNMDGDSESKHREVYKMLTAELRNRARNYWKGKGLH